MRHEKLLLPAFVPAAPALVAAVIVGIGPAEPGVFAETALALAPVMTAAFVPLPVFAFILDAEMRAYYLRRVLVYRFYCEPCFNEPVFLLTCIW